MSYVNSCGCVGVEIHVVSFVGYRNVRHHVRLLERPHSSKFHQPSETIYHRMARTVPYICGAVCYALISRCCITLAYNYPFRRS